MPLPIRKDSHAVYTDKLVYLIARLAAEPKTEALASEVDEVLDNVEEAHRKLIEARRAEMRARALRDCADERGAAELEKYRRRLAATEDASWFVRRLFPGGVSLGRAAGGRAQINRLGHLRARTDELLASPHLASHSEAAELRVTLEHARGVLADVATELEDAVATWEARYRDFERASDAFEASRVEGIERVTDLMSRLGGLLGSTVAAAYAVAIPQTSPETEGEAEGDGALASVVFGAAH